MRSYSKTLYLLGILLFSWTFLFLTYFVYAVKPESFWEGDSLFMAGDPVILSMLFILFVMSATFIVLAFLGNRLLRKSS